MTIVVEDGSNVAGAESYISVADATTYHANRGNTAWAALASDAVREQCLRKATDYLVGQYRARWKGVRVSATQALDWPRAYVYLEPVVTGANTEFPNLVADDTVPTEVKNACAELALRAASGDLLADLTQGVVREKVGPIEVQYDQYSPQSVRYAAIDAMLRPYLARGGNSCVAVRS